MPDITKCIGKDKDEVVCPWRDSCWRYISKASEWQSYFFTIPGFYDKKGRWECSHYWDRNEDE